VLDGYWIKDSQDFHQVKFTKLPFLTKGQFYSSPLICAGNNAFFRGWGVTNNTPNSVSEPFGQIYGTVLFCYIKRKKMTNRNV
jgi:hypothetical protein